MFTNPNMSLTFHVTLLCRAQCTTRSMFLMLTTLAHMLLKLLLFQFLFFFFPPSTGEVSSSMGSLLGTFTPFTMHSARSVLLYLTLVDPSMLSRKEAAAAASSWAARPREIYSLLQSVLTRGAAFYLFFISVFNISFMSTAVLFFRPFTSAYSSALSPLTSIIATGLFTYRPFSFIFCPSVPLGYRRGQRIPVFRM